MTKILLIALTQLLTLQAMRPFFTLVVNNYGERVGLLNAAPVTLGVFLAPFLVPLIVRLLNPRRTLILAVGVLVLARSAMQCIPTADTLLIAASVGTVAGLMAMPLLLAWMRGQEAGGYSFAAAMLIGLMFDAALQALFASWDIVWQRDPFAILLGTAVALLALVLLWRSRWGEAPSEASFRQSLPVAMVGVSVMLHVLFLHNLGYVASRGFPLAVAALMLAIGDALALLALNWAAKRTLRAPVRWVMGIGAALIITLLPNATDIVGVALWALAHMIAAVFLVNALTAGETRHAAVWRTSLAFGIGTLLPILPAIIYFVGQATLLPFAPELVYPALGIVFALGGLERGKPVVKTYSRRYLLLIPLAFLPAIMLLTARAFAPTSPVSEGTTFRIVDYNVHYGINTSGVADPEALAQVIESQNADVVALQEVSRGWLIAGGVDVYEWLALRLGMPYRAFAPAADSQFGNAVLSRYPITAATYAVIPTEGIPQRRSYLLVTLDVNGTEVRLINTHLSAWVDAESHIPQVELVLQAWANAPRTLITGDMNSVPGAPDIQLFFDAGLTSAQDEVGDATAFTANARNPDVRIDWIFGTSDLGFSEFAIPQSQASDHFAVAVTITIEEVE